MVALLLLSPGAVAKSQYVITGPIREHLQRVPDEHQLCRRQGISMNPLVVFMPTAATAVSVYWHRSTDRFVQYPGTSACMVWKRM